MSDLMALLFPVLGKSACNKKSGGTRPLRSYTREYWIILHAIYCNDYKKVAENRQDEDEMTVGRGAWAVILKQL